MALSALIYPHKVVSHVPVTVLKGGADLPLNPIPFAPALP